MVNLSQQARGILITVGGVLVLSPDSLLIRLIDTGAWTLLFWRGLLLCVGLNLWIGLRPGRRAQAAFRSVGRRGLLASLLLAAGTICFVLAIVHTTVANTLIILGAGPLFAAIISRIFLAEPVARRTWFAILAAICGIGVTVSPNLARPSLFGDLCAAGTACFSGGYLAVLRSAPAQDMTPAIALGGLLAAAAVLPWAAPFTLSARDILYLALLGLLVLPLSFSLIALGPRYLPAPEVSLLMLLEMVLGPLWVWLVFGEQPGAPTFLGGAIVLTTLTVHALLALKEAHAPPPAAGLAVD